MKEKPHQSVPNLDKQLRPMGTVDMYMKQVPWKFGVMQGIQAKKIRSSTGAFKNLQGTVTINSFMNGTVNNSLFQNGTLANSVVTGATISQSIGQGGTYTSPVIQAGTLGTPAIIGGNITNGTFGTPKLTGGTWTTPTLNGTALYPVAAATAGLSADNMFALQTQAGSAILVIRSGGTNFFFSPSGTF